MSQKRGDSKKCKQFRIRLTEEDATALKNMSQRYNLPQAQIVRDALVVYCAFMEHSIKLMEDQDGGESLLHPDVRPGHGGDEGL